MGNEEQFAHRGNDGKLLGLKVAERTKGGDVAILSTREIPWDKGGDVAILSTREIPCTHHDEEVQVI
jgi:hypothetical protein